MCYKFRYAHHVALLYKSTMVLQNCITRPFLVSYYKCTLAKLEHRPDFNILRLRQNGRYFADDIFNCIFLNENVWILTNISRKLVPKCQYSSIGSDNGLVPTRWQAIILTNNV